jgi:hypothetical protein
VILSAFQMSPDELPGWAYLSRGTNNQSLSESDNEYRLEAARDQGIRPLITQFEDFINSIIFPLIDANLAKLCRLKLKGLDAYTEEKEAQGLVTQMPIHMTYDEVTRKVEKPPVGREFAGEFPLNPQLQALLDKYCYVDEVRAKFMGLPLDPQLHYLRDPFYFQWLQLQAQMQAQQQQAAQGGGDDAGGAPPDKSGSDDAGSGDAGSDDAGSAADAPTENQKSDQADQGAPQAQKPGEDLSRSLDQAMQVLVKGEKQLPPSKRKLLAQHRITIERLREGLSADLHEAMREVAKEAEQLR